MDADTIRTTLLLAFLVTGYGLLISIPLAWWISARHSKFRTAISATISLPLVLPPSVLGFYLLLALSPTGPLGRVTQLFGLGGLAFTFSGLCLGLTIYIIPYMVRPMRNSFTSIDHGLWEAALTMGQSPIQAFFKVMLPLAKKGIITGVTLGFAHAVGAFGVVLMIGGNIPGKTRVASTAIYSHVETMEYGKAHIYSGILVAVAFVVLFIVDKLDTSNRSVST